MTRCIVTTLDSVVLFVSFHSAAFVVAATTRRRRLIQVFAITVAVRP